MRGGSISARTLGHVRTLVKDRHWIHPMQLQVYGPGVPAPASSFAYIVTMAQSLFRGCTSALLPSKAASNNVGMLNHQIRTLTNRMGSVTRFNWPDWQLAQNLYSQRKNKGCPLGMGSSECFLSVHINSVAFQINKSPTGGCWKIITLLPIVLMSIKSPSLRRTSDWSLGRVGGLSSMWIL